MGHVPVQEKLEGKEIPGDRRIGVDFDARPRSGHADTVEEVLDDILVDELFPVVGEEKGFVGEFRPEIHEHGERTPEVLGTVLREGPGLVRVLHVLRIGAAGELQIFPKVADRLDPVRVRLQGRNDQPGDARGKARLRPPEEEIEIVGDRDALKAFAAHDDLVVGGDLLFEGFAQFAQLPVEGHEGAAGIGDGVVGKAPVAAGLRVADALCGKRRSVLSEVLLECARAGFRPADVQDQFLLSSHGTRKVLSSQVFRRGPPRRHGGERYGV